MCNYIRTLNSFNKKYIKAKLCIIGINSCSYIFNSTKLPLLSLKWTLHIETNLSSIRFWRIVINSLLKENMLILISFGGIIQSGEFNYNSWLTFIVMFLLYFCIVLELIKLSWPLPGLISTNCFERRWKQIFILKILHRTNLDYL